MKFPCDMCSVTDVDEKEFLFIRDMSGMDNKVILKDEYYICPTCRKKILDVIFNERKKNSES